MPAGGATLSVAPDGALAMDGAGLEHSRYEAVLAELLEGNRELRLRVNAHKDAELRHVLPLVSTAEALGVRDVVLVVTPSSERRTMRVLMSYLGGSSMKRW